MNTPKSKSRKTAAGDKFPASPSTAQEWAAFTIRLAQVLDDLGEDEYLIVSEKKRNVYVQFSGLGYFGMWAEAVSNEYLFPNYRLKRTDITALKRIGWHQPTCRDGQQTAEKSPNFHIGIERSTPRAQLAHAAVRALCEVYRTHHPGDLQYQAFQGDEAYAIRFPGLGLKRKSD